MAKAYQLFRGNKPMDNQLYKDKNIAEKEKNIANKQFKEFNKLVEQGKINREKIKLVKVKEITFSRKDNVFG